MQPLTHVDRHFLHFALTVGYCHVLIWSLIFEDNTEFLSLRDNSFSFLLPQSQSRSSFPILETLPAFTV